MSKKSQIVSVNTIEPFSPEEKAIQLLDSYGIAKGTIDVTDSSIHITGVTHDNKVTFSKELSGGLLKQSMTEYVTESFASRVEQAKSLYKQGYTQKRIAGIMGVSQKTVSNYINN